MRLAGFFLSSLLIAAVSAAPVSACPSCKEAVAESAPSSAAASADPGVPPPIDVSAGYDASIILMFGMPFVLLGGLGWMMLRSQPGRIK